ncbi:Bug family tripartite tricarboxylate transporter substrate binding protein [Pseudonocardia adelaidensis]|uniref:Tripartite tricarboxylate transporter substrate binding protein n=1 Tax=Pseudonocardia adelaidensis TaxID=648754 RepID=A0ABP9NPT4_9PSEU
MSTLTRTTFPVRTRKRTLRAAVAGLVALGTVTACGGAGEPADPADFDQLETIIVQSAGGGTDVLARTILDRFVRPQTDATLVTRNDEGDAGLLGLSTVERSDPDEAVIGFVNTTTLYAQYARGEDAAVDMREMTPIAGYGRLPAVLVVNPALGVHTIEDLAALYQAQQLPIGGASPGGSSELSAHRMKADYGLSWTEYVAYDGSADLLAAIARGEVPAGAVSDTSAADALAAGTAVPILTLGSERSKEVPEVPSAVETGLPATGSGENHRLIVASSRLDPALRDRLVEIFEKALTSPEAAAWAAENAVALDYSPPADVDRLIDQMFADIDSIPGAAEILQGS